jgi:hypothetical protein
MPSPLVIIPPSDYIAFEHGKLITINHIQGEPAVEQNILVEVHPEPSPIAGEGSFGFIVQAKPLDGVIELTIRKATAMEILA